MAEEGNDGQPVVLYHYKDAEGRDVVVSSLEDVPPARRSAVETYDPAAPTVQPGIASPEDVLRHVPTWVGPVHLASLATGVLLVVLGAVVWRVLRTRRRLAFLAFAFAAVCLAMSAYLAFVLRTAGLSDDALAHPGEIVEQAERTVEDANRATRAKERALEAAGRD